MTPLSEKDFTEGVTAFLEKYMSEDSDFEEDALNKGAKASLAKVSAHAKRKGQSLGEYLLQSVKSQRYIEKFYASEKSFLVRDAHARQLYVPFFHGNGASMTLETFLWQSLLTQIMIDELKCKGSTIFYKDNGYNPLYEADL